jgi:hypothetical protein
MITSTSSFISGRVWMSSGVMYARIIPSGEDMPFPDFCSSRSFFSMRSHMLMSASFPVNIGDGKSMNICFAVSSAPLGTRGV